MEEENDRRRERVPINGHIDIRRPGDHRYKVNIEDFSAEGCRVEIPVAIDIGDSVFIILPGIESIEGKVRWKRDWTIGVEFVRPLYPSVFEMIRTKFG